MNCNSKSNSSEEAYRRFDVRIYRITGINFCPFISGDLSIGLYVNNIKANQNEMRLNHMTQIKLIIMHDATIAKTTKKKGGADRNSKKFMTVLS